MMVLAIIILGAAVQRWIGVLSGSKEPLPAES